MSPCERLWWEVGEDAQEGGWDEWARELVSEYMGGWE
jgi:hypothetical protein